MLVNDKRRARRDRRAALRAPADDEASAIEPVQVDPADLRPSPIDDDLL
jgi:hypothetical protein